MGSKSVLGIINIRRDTSYVKFLKAFENRGRWFKNDLEFRVKVLDFLVTFKSVYINIFGNETVRPIFSRRYLNLPAWVVK